MLVVVAAVEVPNCVVAEEVNGAAAVLEMVIGAAPIAVKDVQVTPVPHATEVVATLWTAPLPAP